MTRRPLAICLSAAALGLLCLPALAESAEAPPAKHEAVAKKPHAKKPAKAAGRTPAVPAIHPSLLGSDTGDESSSLERRRKAFFAPKPDEGGPQEDAPSAGVTLGGSGGITPGMGMKF